MRDKTYDEWADAREIWRTCKGERFGKKLSEITVFILELWWQSNPNPHGWNTSTRAKYAKGFKRERLGK